MRVGIPRALLFHHYGEKWLSFLESLGVEAVLTGATTGSMITEGAFRADNETCLPVKVFTGHVLKLKDSVDFILVPRVISQGHGTCACPKFMGLPDMARCLDKDLPPVLAPAMDLGDMRYRWAADWYRVGRLLGGGRAASARAVLRMLDCSRGVNANRESIERADSGLSVGVAGHSYNVHDSRVSLGLLDRIRKMGANPVTVEEVPFRKVRKESETLPRKIFWGFERRLAGAVLHWSRTATVSGILFVTSFACGPGSMVGALLEDELYHHESVPMMTITLDEHAAEAGLITRIEAFIDMLRRTSRPQLRLASTGRDGG